MTISIITLWLFIILFYCVIGTWKLFEKAGRKQWEGLVPIYNILVWLKLIHKPWWWILILLIPGWNLLLMFGSMNVSMGRIFGKFSAKDTILQILLPFVYFPMLAYDKEAKYQGETNWDNKEERERRKLSDQIALFFASFGLINVLVAALKLTGSKDKPGQKTMVKEWGDSIIFALIAASIIRGYVLEAFTIPTPSMEKELLVGDFLFVNKFAYGSRVPLTPISFPLAHNTVPFTYVNSYSTAINLPYYRLPGFGKVQRNDIVVFNHPVGDTAVFGRYPGSEGAGGELQGHNYYEFIRGEAFRIAQGQVNSEAAFFKNKGMFESMARDNILNKHKLYGFDIHGYTTRPIDKKENYIKRCVAVAGDTLQIVNGKLFVNGKFNDVGDNVNFNHYVQFNRALSQQELQEFKASYNLSLGLYKDIKDAHNESELPRTANCIINLSDKEKLKMLTDIKGGKYGNLQVLSISQKIDSSVNRLSAYQHFYPNHEKFAWNVDNYGPLWMPKEGATIPMNYDNWIKYNRCITTYENNPTATWKGDGVYIDGKKITEYTFKQDYYYMIGDNRHNSADSRMWGFVPEDHVVGKGLIIWMSKDPEEGWFSGGVRWGRIFRTF